MTEKFLTPRQLAQRWDFNIETLKQWRWYGKGPRHRKFGGRVKYDLEEIEKYETEAIRDHTTQGSVYYAHPR